ncbi:MAG: hypothetical protein COV45_02165 [Deltaproteobacteria bacterium CG11_big_fil_rev_8_21_14_0_20_47_16]|nr:MAG: hypothetical protein COV45_02165 [Deltaproteobacteria bacterium CG11_big_fil_rev_8_21_14_0_20_47_16]
MKRIAIIALLFVACTRTTPTPLINWQTSAAPGKPAIYKFATSWCPYCARLDETVFAYPKVVEAAKQFSMVYVDGDLPASDALMKKYAVRGYPTIIFTQPNGTLVATSQDDTDPDHFLELMQITLSSSATTPDEKIYLAAVADEMAGRDVAALQKFHQALPYIAQHRHSTKSMDNAFAHILLFEVTYYKDRDPKRTQKAAQVLLQEFPNNPMLPFVYLDFAHSIQHDPELQKRILRDGVQTTLRFLKATPQSMRLQYDMAPDYFDILIEMYTKLGDTDAAQRITRQAGPLLLDRIKAANQPRDARSLFSSTIYFLREAGYYKEARYTAELAINTWPKDFLYHKRLAEVDVALLGDNLSSSKKRLKEALHEYDLAMKYAYGRNMLGVADGYSNLLIRLGRTDDAHAVIRKAIAAVDWSKNTRQRELKLKEKLEKR